MIECIESVRGTGRTFRMLLKAMETASSGKRVVVVCRDSKHARMLLQRAAEMCRCEGIVSYSEKTIRFSDKGRMYFSHAADVEQDMIGLGKFEVFTDEL